MGAPSLTNTPYTWTRGDVIAVALHGCTHCYGLGFRLGRDGAQSVCNCVLRNIFKGVYQAFRKYARRDAYISRVNLQQQAGRRNKRTFGFLDQEFCADFVLLSKRTLGANANTLAWRLFDWHYLRGADWKGCCRQLGINRGAFFHELYRIQQRLGRAYRETKPYGLWPVDEYFGRHNERPREHKLLELDSSAAPTLAGAPLPRVVYPPLRQAA